MQITDGHPNQIFIAAEEVGGGFSAPSIFIPLEYQGPGSTNVPGIEEVLHYVGSWQGRAYVQDGKKLTLYVWNHGEDMLLWQSQIAYALHGYYTDANCPQP